MNRLPLVLSLLLLFFFVSTSSGFAQVSAIQEKLRDIQLKLVKERIKLIQEEIFKVSAKQNQELSVSQPAVKESTMSREELSSVLQAQIASLEQVVASLRPRALDEEVARIDKRIGEINSEINTAEGKRLVELQNELSQLAGSYTRVQQAVRNSLEDSIKARQAAVIREQLRILQEKLLLLPRPVLQTAPAVPVEVKAKTDLIQGQIEQIRLKLLQTQMKVIQEKILQLKAK